jgi:hypothetical protein
LAVIGTHRIAAIFLAGCWLLPLAACSRTSDGTVVMKKPPAISTLLPGKPVLLSWMRRKPSPPEEPSIVAAQFPPPPERKAARAKKRMTPAAVRPDADAKLVCHNQTGSDGRVRVICK